MANKTTRTFQIQARTLRDALGVLEEFWLKSSRQCVIHHNAYDYSQAAASVTPSWVDLDNDGNIRGLNFTPTDYLNGITLLMQLENLFTNSAVTQGAYQHTMSLVTNPS